MYLQYSAYSFLLGINDIWTMPLLGCLLHIHLYLSGICLQIHSFLPSSSSIYFTRRLPRACCVHHPSANRDWLRYLWWLLIVCKTNHTWLIRPCDLGHGAWHWVAFTWCSLIACCPWPYPCLPFSDHMVYWLLLNLLHIFISQCHCSCNSAKKASLHSFKSYLSLQDLAQYNLFHKFFSHSDKYISSLCCFSSSLLCF